MHSFIVVYSDLISVTQVQIEMFYIKNEYLTGRIQNQRYLTLCYFLKWDNKNKSELFITDCFIGRVEEIYRNSIFYYLVDKKNEQGPQAHGLIRKQNRIVLNSMDFVLNIWTVKFTGLQNSTW